MCTSGRPDRGEEEAILDSSWRSALDPRPGNNKKATEGIKGKGGETPTYIGTYYRCLGIFLSVCESSTNAFPKLGEVGNFCIRTIL